MLTYPDFENLICLMNPAVAKSQTDYREGCLMMESERKIFEMMDPKNPHVQILDAPGVGNKYHKQEQEKNP
ncbi:hypothetical protein NQ317_019910 [Molorchus minor]|uniref:Uncharacterized protein n=1 Tax=Molorchus minor TaxID=1323400 RepID=A0ABQ9K676_9CUCU|nr:hypothetical protein NQ317_019910 [Molorchus minor]